MKFEITPWTGQIGNLTMPLVKNIPVGHEGWKKTECPSCGRQCWERPEQKEILKNNPQMGACCTDCALRHSGAHGKVIKPTNKGGNFVKQVWRVNESDYICGDDFQTALAQYCKETGLDREEAIDGKYFHDCDLNGQTWWPASELTANEVYECIIDHGKEGIKFDEDGDAWVLTSWGRAVECHGDKGVIIQSVYVG